MTDAVDSCHPTRVLILAPNWLGDVIMATPLLSLLSGSDGSAPPHRCRITLGIRRRWAPLFAADRRVADIVQLERQGRHRGMAGLWRQARDFGGGRWDGVVITPPSLRAALVCALAGIPNRIGYAADGRSLLLTDAVPGVRRGDLHYSRELLSLGARLLERLHLDSKAFLQLTDPLLPRLELGPDPIVGSSLTPAAATDPATVPLWVVAPGTTYGEAKTWPMQRVAEFVDLAVNRAGVRVALLGDPTAVAFARQMRTLGDLPWRDTLPGSAGVVDLTGRTDLTGAVAVLRQATAFVGNDSGLMHVAAALGISTVGVFGSSSPDWTAPLGVRTAVVVAEGFDCRPCFRRTCNQDEFCLETVDAESVLAAVSQLLQDQAAEEP